MSKPSGQVCALCRHGQHSEIVSGAIVRQRVCRRFPPSLLIPSADGRVGFFQPYVSDDLTCGEWVPVATS